MSLRALVRYWLPPILWAAVIFAASSDLFSSGHTAPLLETIITAILGHPLQPAQFDAIHFVVRKGAHLAEYGILGALLFRALRGSRAGWDARWSAAAVILAALFAATDEWHQMFVPSRTASAWDALVDTIGAALAQVLFFRR